MLHRLCSILPIACVAITLASPGTSKAGFTPFSAAGNDTPASIQSTVDAFRAAVGDPNNGNSAGPITGGRREINWDGGGAVPTSSPTPFTGFLNNRGAGFETPGTGFLQTPPDAPFHFFSSPRIFTSVGSNITDVTFIVPGTAPAGTFGTGIPATVSGFGAVFTDVNSSSSSLEFFDINNHSLFGAMNVAPVTVAGGLSFLGFVANAGEEIARVRITAGTPPGGVDAVALDDFIYSEPKAIPEPASLTLMGSGLVGLLGYVVWLRRKRVAA